jgi:hypothetical protein
MNQNVSLTFRYLESDYVRALRTHYRTRLRLRLDVAVVVLTAGVGVYFWRSSDLRWLGVIGVVVSVLFALMLIAAFTVIPHLVFRREAKFRDEYTLTFSPEGIHFRTASIDSQLQWSLYPRALVDAHSYLLYYGSTQFTVIPVRVFQNAEQQEDFERLLAQRISQIIRQEQ